MTESNQGTCLKKLFLFLMAVFFVVSFSTAAWSGHDIVSSHEGLSLTYQSTYISEVSTGLFRNRNNGSVKFNNQMVVNLKCEEGEKITSFEVISTPKVAGGASHKGGLVGVQADRQSGSYRVPYFDILSRDDTKLVCLNRMTNINLEFEIDVHCVSDATGNIVMRKDTAIIPVGVKCEDAPEFASVKPIVFRYECPDGFVVESYNRSAIEVPYGKKLMCVRP